MLTLNAKTRKETGKKNQSLRDQKMIPAVIYGHGVLPQSIAVEYNPFKKIYDEAGGNTIISLKIDDGEPVDVLIHEIQTDPVLDFYRHVDFYQIKKGEKITTDIELTFAGESKAVKELGGILIKQMDAIEVECLPKDLVHQIEVDISPLNTFSDAIHVKDLKIPAGMEVLNEPDEVVVNISEPKAEEEKPVTEAMPVVEGEKKEEEKKEGEKKK